MESLECNSNSDLQLFYDLKDIVLGSPKAELLRIQYILVATTLLYAVQHFLGARRSFCGSNRVATQLIHKSLPLAMGLALWLMHSARAHVHILYPVWASAMASTLNTGVVCNHKPIWACYPIYASLPFLTWTIWFAVSSAPYNAATPIQISLGVILLAGFWIVGVLDAVETLGAFVQARKHEGLEEMENRDDEDPERDPVSMRGYKFQVWNTITTEIIWERMRKTRLSSYTDYADVERLQDMCLSYAFFRLLLKKFPGSRASNGWSELLARRFIRQCLLTNQDSKRLFRVIEMELGFLFDFFYSKSPVYRPFSFRHSVGVIALVLLGTVGLFGTQMLEDDGCKSKGVEFVQMVMMLYILIWFKNFLLGSSPNSRMVWCLCIGLTRVETENEDEAATSLSQLITGKDCLYRMGKLFGNQPWQRKLGQYSLLETSYGKASIFFSPMATVPLTDQVKRAIVGSLATSYKDAATTPLQLSRGKSSITKHQVNDVNQYILGSTTADVILVWHIATSFWESVISANGEDDDDGDYILVATQLSKYCAYLLAYSPDLLPGEPRSAQRLFNQAVEQAVGLRRQGLKMGDLYHSLISPEAILNANNDNFVIDGAILASRLKHHNFVIDGAILASRLKQQKKGWRFLAEFWSEMLLYLAPSDDVAAHREYLARGGEFITHVWALVTHVGVVRS